MKSQHEVLMDDEEFRREFIVEKFISECTEVLARVMEERKVTKAEVARKMGKSRAWMTQLLNGGRNVTARTIAEVAFELDVELRIESSLPSANLEYKGWRVIGSVTVDKPLKRVPLRILEFSQAETRQPAMRPKLHSGSDSDWSNSQREVAA